MNFKVWHTQSHNLRQRISIHIKTVAGYLAKSLGYTFHHTTAYHPQANGMVERFHRNLKKALKARLRDNDWVLALPWVMLEIRTAPKEDLNCSAAEMVFGSTLLVPGEFVSPPQRQHDLLISKFVPKTTDFHGNSVPKTTDFHGNSVPKTTDFHGNSVPKTTDFHGNSKCSPIKALDTADFVFVRVDRHKTPLYTSYEGPFRVIGKSDKTLTIIKQNKEEVISIDRLKPAYLHNHIKPSPSQSTPSPAVAPSSSSPPPPNRISSSPPPPPSRISSSPPPTLFRPQPTPHIPQDMAESLNLPSAVLVGSCVVD